jgi:hypothetical protein
MNHYRQTRGGRPRLAGLVAHGRKKLQAQKAAGARLI